MNLIKKVLRLFGKQELKPLEERVIKEDSKAYIRIDLGKKD